MNGWDIFVSLSASSGRFAYQSLTKVFLSRIFFPRHLEEDVIHSANIVLHNYSEQKWNRLFTDYFPSAFGELSNYDVSHVIKCTRLSPLPGSGSTETKLSSSPQLHIAG